MIEGHHNVANANLAGDCSGMLDLAVMKHTIIPVTATVASPKARLASAATTELSAPPEKAIAALPYERMCATLSSSIS